MKGRKRVAMDAYGKGLFTYAYDEADRQVRVTTPQLRVTSMAYDAVGRLTDRRLASGALTTQAYDPAGNVGGITSLGPLGTLVCRFTYTYDKADRRRVQAEADGTVTTWTYDRASRLTNERRAGGPAGTSFNVTHSYDPAGNRTGVDDGATAVAYAYTPANRLVLATVGGGVTTYQHDAAGHRTAVVPPSGASTLYAWDAAGQLVEAEAADAAGPVTFTYDADGRRVAKQAADGSATGYLYDLARLLHGAGCRLKPAPQSGLGGIMIFRRWGIRLGGGVGFW